MARKNSNKTHAADMYSGVERHDTGGRPKGYAIPPADSRSFYEEIGREKKSEKSSKPNR